MTLRRPAVLREVELVLIEPNLDTLDLGESDLSCGLDCDTLPGVFPAGEGAVVVMAYASGGVCLRQELAAAQTGQTVTSVC